VKQLNTPDLAERDLLVRLDRDLRDLLPRTWAATVDARDRETGSGQPDAWLDLRLPDGRSVRLPVEVKTILNTRDVPWVRERLPGSGDGLVVARYLSPRTREALVDAGLSYLDATGNRRIRLDDPALYIQTDGAKADPWRGPARETSSLKGRPAARVVRALVDFRPPYGVRELADLASTSPASVSRVADFLSREALIERDAKGAIVDCDWAALLHRWSADYSFERTNRVVPMLEPRGIDEVLARLRDGNLEYAVTASAAAAEVAEFAETRLLALYVEDEDLALESLGLRFANATNVLLARPFDPVVFERSREIDGVRYAALSQVAVDLLTSPGRSPAAGEALISWMSQNEDSWRSPTSS
jgi:hypothetical protein